MARQFFFAIDQRRECQPRNLFGLARGAIGRMAAL
jgi:hypothetical protein